MASLNDRLLIQLFEKTSSACKAVRITIILICFSSIIISLSLWNSLQKSWLDCRIKIHENQVRWQPYFIGDSIPINISEEERRDFFNAKRYYYKHHYDNEILHSNLVNLHCARIDNVLLIKIPILGTGFDINDLGIIGGLVFSCFLFILVINALNKRNNLQMLFSHIHNHKEIDKELSFDLISSNQTLIIPLRASSEENHASSMNIWRTNFKRILQRTPDVVVLFPMILQFLILLHDYFTFELGNELNILGTYTSYFFSGLLLFFVVILTVSYWTYARYIEKLWIEHYLRSPVEPRESK